jgi:hypothetical protein
MQFLSMNERDEYALLSTRDWSEKQFIFQRSFLMHDTGIWFLIHGVGCIHPLKQQLK